LQTLKPALNSREHEVQTLTLNAKAAWSSASVAGIPLHQYPATKSLDREAIAAETRQKAAALIDNKGSTEFGIGSVTTSICKSILFDQRNVRPVSVYDEDLRVYLSRPVVLGRKGIEQVLELPLDDGEQKALKASAESLRSVIEEAEKKEKEQK
jgi:L-lactate dehydrogenase